jgi:hypothetical protein
VSLINYSRRLIVVFTAEIDSNKLVGCEWLTNDIYLIKNNKPHLIRFSRLNIVPLQYTKTKTIMVHTITYKDSLKAIKKANRETMHTVKPIKTTDKRKQASKDACRNYRYL